MPHLSWRGSRPRIRAQKAPRISEGRKGLSTAHQDAPRSAEVRSSGSLRVVSTARLAVLLAVVVSLGLAAPAAGAQYQRGAANANWAMSGPFFTNWEQDIVVTRRAKDTFWNIQWTKVYGPDGYLGIQTRGGTAKFHFSMWGATDSRDGTGRTCQSFREEGSYGYTTGTQCQTPVGTALTNRTIRLKLFKSNPTNDNDLWWSAEADIQGIGGKYLGQLKAPHAGWLERASNFHEYFGPGKGWNRVAEPSSTMNKTKKRCVPPGPPRSAAVFGAPTVSAPNLSARKLARTGTGLNTCPGTAGKAIPFHDGVFTQLGDRPR